MIRSGVCVLSCAALLACSAVQAAVIGPALQSVVDASEPTASIPVILRFHGRPEPRAFRHADRQERRRALVQTLKSTSERERRTVVAELALQGGRDLRPLWMINGLAARLPATLIRTLAHHPRIASLALDEVLPLWHDAVTATGIAEWNLDHVHAPDVWSRGFRGQGVVIASMDTGVDLRHPELAARWRGGANSWFDPNGQHATPVDNDGHGTWTTGILVGGDAAGSAIGVAPDAVWIAVKIFDDAHVAPLSAIHLGFQWLLDPDGDPLTDDAPDIVNNSWGFESLPNVCLTEFEADIQTLRAAGIAVVFAAGNTGPAESTSISPANNAGALAVGAVDQSFAAAGFSARGSSACGSGQFPQLSAPGVGVRTSDRCFGVLCDYVTVSGTSFAAPHVAGVMALLLSALPGATPEQLEAAMQASARDLGAPGPDTAFGFGLVDAAAALDALQCPPDGVDADGDGVVDVCDNCIQIANADQRDSNADGYGNVCDTDLNNDAVTNGLDTGIFRSAFLSADADADFNGDGVVNSLDSGILKSFYLLSPGPSGVAP